MSTRLMSLTALAVAAVLPAQSLPFTIELPDGLAATAHTLGAPPQFTNIPSGRIPAPFDLVAVTQGAEGSLRLNAGVTDQAFDAWIVASVGVGHDAPAGSSAGIGDASVIVRFDLPRPLTARLRLAVTAVVTTSAPATRGCIDLGDDGSTELKFISKPGVCGGDQVEHVVALPAGPFRVRLALHAELPGIVDQVMRLANVIASLHLEAAQVDVEHEGSACGSVGLDATPMLDGEHLRLWLGNHPWDLGIGVVGLQRTSLPLPGLGCPLLVQPDIVFTAPSPYTFLRVADLSGLEFFVQGVVWRPDPRSLGTGWLFSTQRTQVRVR